MIDLSSRFVQAALSVKRLQQPQLAELAWHLHEMDRKRQAVKGKPMSDDHLKQEAWAWARSR